MQLIKKTARTVIGGGLVTLGLVFVIIPGPSLLLIVPGLFLLSYDYVWAKAWLRKCQVLMKKAATKIDAFIAKRKMQG
ncbi:PGPGW domain-containing protein [Glaciecola sp. MH2013]|uniref:PGPGW domain-containing protein n=1 Tax=Glaciecola sp. MH2013 TaxID=2785524 RepID=UPI00189E7284|nr:PGPGW domain-containing protein [Glaciecola sp. MH2013]MBF7074218.1 PGPGW domain-containing protein [Glaciecola sp. MH2013]